MERFFGQLVKVKQIGFTETLQCFGKDKGIIYRVDESKWILIFSHNIKILYYGNR